MKYTNYVIYAILSFLLALTPLANTSWAMENSASMHITIIGDKNNATAKTLYDTAVKYAPKQAAINWLSATEAAKMPDSEYPHFDKPVAFLCISEHCSLPILTPQMLATSIKKFSANMDVNHNSTKNKFIHLLKTSNLLIIIPIFWFFGLLLSLTPCLLPLMIIITSIIGGNAVSISRTKCVMLSLTYILSLAITYAAAGIAVASFGLYLQGFMQKTWIIVTFSMLFVLLGLSLFGFVNFQIPNRWRRAASSYSIARKSGSYIGVALMGILATLIASPCVAAPLAGILAYIAESGNVRLGGIALFFTGVGIGSPVIFVSAVGVELLQKAGEWQKYVKQFFGILLLGIAIWLLGRVISPTTTMILWASLLLFTAIYMGLLERQAWDPYHDDIHHPSVKFISSLVKTVCIMMLVYGGALVAGALIGNTNPLAPLNNLLESKPDTSITLSSFHRIHNLADLKRMKQISRARKMPVMVIFSARWCTACKDIEANVFPDAKVQTLFGHYTLLYVDLTDANDETTSIARQFNVAGPPVILLYSSSEKYSSRIDGDTSAADLADALTSILKK